MKTAIAAGTALALAVTTTVPAQAFCGFYVSGSNKKMYNDATQVVLMRSGTRTVLSMQNDYRGPLEDFAMVVPVPVVLKQSDVRVLPKEVFDRVDSLGSPRLVEYWEQDPCPLPLPKPTYRRMSKRPMKARMPAADLAPRASFGAGGGGYATEKQDRPAVPPVLTSFSVYPPSITADVSTPVRWNFGFARQPWPTPTCTIDHGVGAVGNGTQRPLKLAATTTFTLTCANSAGRSSKRATVNVVKIEAKFNVAEYQILILSATEAAGLEQWLKLNHYKIPKDAERLLRPYVESGSKFFVAKVDPQKVKMVDGHAALSPLRFDYDSDEFSLPIRLGMANSSGKQDLIVNIISPDRRYEVANYKNVFIPTNIDVKPSVKNRFSEFYTALFDKTMQANPRSVVTEYAWTAMPSPYGNGPKCDPCPPVIPEDKDMITLGGDVIGGTIRQGGFVLTRLHTRYGKNDIKDDLMFREAKPVTGGREIRTRKGLEYGATPSAQNFFQARYSIRHWWTGPIRCQNPRRGVWGGPPDGGANQIIAAGRTAFTPRGKLQLASVVQRDIWEIGFKRARNRRPAPKRNNGASVSPKKKTMWFGAGAMLGLLVIGAGAVRSRRRRDEDV